MRFLNDISKVVYIKKTQQSFNYTNEGLYTWQIRGKKNPLMGLRDKVLLLALQWWQWQSL